MSGFGIREIAIVIVTVLLFYIIGKNIKDSSADSSLLSEITRVEKIATAVNIYNSAHTKVSRGEQRNIVKDLLDDAFLEESDFYSPYSKGYWNFIGCSFDDDNGTFFLSGNIANDSGICLYLNSIPPYKEHPLSKKTVPERLVCYMELFLDDMKNNSGKGRGDAFSDNISISSKESCLEIPSTNKINYMFKIF